MAPIVGWLWPLEGPGGTSVGVGHLDEVGWAIPLVLFLLLWVVRRLRRRKSEEERRAIVEENRRKARRLYEEAFGKGDFSVIDEVIDEGFVDHLGHRRGPEGFKRSLASLRRTFPDLQVSVEEQSVEGASVTTRCMLRGVDRGGVLWYPPTEKRVAFAATYTDSFSGGMLVEHRGRTDTAGLLEQLGLPLRSA
jgi:predicted ester cyclase